MTPAAGLCLADAASCELPPHSETGEAVRRAISPENLRSSRLTVPTEESAGPPSLGNEKTPDQIAPAPAKQKAPAEPITVLVAQLKAIAPWLLDGQASAVTDSLATSLHPASEPEQNRSSTADALDYFDNQLTPIQREIVRRALTSKVFLLQGPPASGKMRVVVELIQHLLSRHLRVVVTSPRLETLHALVERLQRVADANRGTGMRWEDLLTLYLPAPEESASLSSVARNWSAEVRGAAWLARWRQRCLATLCAADQERDRLNWVSHLLQQLECLAQEYEREQRNLESHRQALAQLQEEFRRWLTQSNDVALNSFNLLDSEELQQALQQEKRKHEATIADLHQRLDQARQQAEVWAKEVEHWQERVAWQEAVVAVRHARAFWRWLWWKSLFQSSCREQLAEFQARLEEARQHAQAGRNLCEELRESIRREQERHAAAREHILQSALEQCQLRLSRELQQSSERLADLSRKWSTLRAELLRLVPGLLCPESPQLEAVRAAHDHCRRWAEQVATEHALGQNLLATLTRWGAQEAILLAERAHLCIAPLSVLSARESLRRANSMIVLDAHSVSEDVWNWVQPSADQVVLCGEPNWDVPTTEEKQFSSVLHQHWQEIGGGSLVPSCRWIQSAAGITCQLTPMLGASPSQITTEPLADQPEVLLRFLELPSQRLLAEVFFPSPQFDIRQAKTFLSSQMDQVLCWPAWPLPRWRELEKSWCCDWAPASLAATDTPPATVRVDYGQGVTEELLPVASGDGKTAWRTIRIDFDKGEGWSLEEAQSWLRDWTNSTVHPDACWLWCWRGGTGPLADWPAWVLGYVGAKNLSGLWRVPSQADKSSRPRWRERRRADPPDCVDLASDQRKRLPIAWQCILPARGCILPREAEQLVQLLRSLAPALQRQAASWHIVGWWGKAQLELLRWLWQQPPIDGAERFRFFSLQDLPDYLPKPPPNNGSSLASDGVLIVVASGPTNPRGIRWQDWIWCGALARKCLVILEPDYEQVFRQLNAQGNNSPWLSDLLQRCGTLPVLPGIHGDSPRPVQP